MTATEKITEPKSEEVRDVPDLEEGDAGEVVEGRDHPAGLRLRGEEQAEDASTRRLVESDETEEASDDACMPLCGGVKQGENGEKKGGEASEADASWRFIYRPEIDGLRFWAVMPVVFYHYGTVLGFTGGYAGVDVFFVISGYLITSIVLRELCMGKPVLRHFWERRVRRLFPAIATMFVCLYIYGWFMLAPSVYNNFVGESIFGLIAGSNFYYYVTTKDLGGYTAAGPEAYPLLHFWSLAVEEQFYLVLPVVLVCVWRFCKTDRKRWMTTLGVFGFVFLASFAFSVGYTPINNPFCFYLLFARAWELLIGSFIGIATSDLGIASMSRVLVGLGLNLTSKYFSPLAKRLMLEATGWLGFGLILFVYFYFTREMEYTYPYYYALGPCAGALMVIVGTTPVFKPTKDLSKDGDGDGEERIMTTCGLFLSFSPFVWIGKISYALYLWHWPLWCFQGGERLSWNNVVSALMLTMIAIGLSAVSTDLIEQPFRCKKRVDRKSLWIISGIVWAALLSFSISVHLLDVGGSNKTIAARADEGLNSTSAIYVPTGDEPFTFFLEDANPELFSLEGIEKSGRKAATNSMGWRFLVPRKCEGVTAKNRYYDECPAAEKNIVYNKAKDPPCLAFLGNSHLGHHALTIASLAKEYNVSFQWLQRDAGGDLFGGAGACTPNPDPPTAWDEQRIRILEQWKPKRVVFATVRPQCLLENNATLDALMSGDPEKVLIMGDNPALDYESLPFKLESQNHGLLQQLAQVIQAGNVGSLDFLSAIKPLNFDEFLSNEDQLREAIDTNPKYNTTVQFESTYPAFMDENNTYVQVVGAETKGGNRMIYLDNSHLNPDGSKRLTEYFREYIFSDLKC